MSAKPKKKKHKWSWLRYRKDDLAHNVQVAVQRWIHANDGTAVLMSGIQLVTFPDDGQFNYRVAIRCTGKIPAMKEK